MGRVKNETARPTRRSERVQDRQLAAVIKKEEEEKATKVSKKKRFRRPKQRKNCHLLALPGEIRNRIYRFALVEHAQIAITPKGPGQPSLLRTCRVLRKDGRGIYYGENDFSLRLHQYNGADFVPFARQYHDYEFPTVHLGKGNVYFNFTGKPNWENLVAWLKAAHCHEAMLPDMKDPIFSFEFILGGAIKVVESVNWMSWAQKEKALEGFYLGLRGTCSKWVKEDERGLH